MRSNRTCDRDWRVVHQTISLFLLEMQTASLSQPPWQAVQTPNGDCPVEWGSDMSLHFRAWSQKPPVSSLSKLMPHLIWSAGYNSLTADAIHLNSKRDLSVHLDSATSTIGIKRPLGQELEHETMLGYTFCSGTHSTAVTLGRL